MEPTGRVFDWDSNSRLTDYELVLLPTAPSRPSILYIFKSLKMFIPYGRKLFSEAFNTSSFSIIYNKLITGITKDRCSVSIHTNTVIMSALIVTQSISIYISVKYGQMIKHVFNFMNFICQ